MSEKKYGIKIINRRKDHTMLVSISYFDGRFEALEISCVVLEMRACLAKLRLVFLS